ncbi:chemotaxis-specific protein-glutamate methyltransferase CheB [Georgenia ruanii]|uniref:Protein-glutamate methylesterase/protein-glutamine glutaminase n=1 Tax=Georgenia ruanii TaxID=348442 RepID=A0A7J9UYM7_9MICO|nr:chemotaxis-specific protein-glutamate methyltransferase CheB [Georgenia ruanii]MPV89739.1 chemotaxis-specific protein-glutamate methyltransferase CheB [Georgenia ruanii]
MTTLRPPSLPPWRGRSGAPGRRVRVLVVDDSAVMRRLVTGALGRDRSVEVVGTAADGRSALAQVVELLPDVVTMDVEMPQLDGIGAVRALRGAGLHVPVIMLSTLTEHGATATLDALAAGASDYVTKPTGTVSLNDSLRHLTGELLPRIHALALGGPPREPANPPPPRRAPVAARAVVLGASTGGPEALSRLFAALPAPPTVPLLVVQHMPAVFTRQLAGRLDRVGPTSVAEAAGSEALEPGRAYIAPGDHHLAVVADGGLVRAVVRDDPPVNFYRPSVDVLFSSAAEVYGPALHAVVLTGMGTDGRDGAAAVVAAGGTVHVQDAASSVVWGMPGAVAEAGLAHDVLSLEHLARVIATAGAPGRAEARR